MGTDRPASVEPESPRRREWPKVERPVPGETGYEARQRRHRNRQSRADFERWAYVKCSRCGMARINVVHEQDPATAPEGPEYYADFEQHPFEGERDGD